MGDGQILRPFIGRCVVVYFDDILIYSADPEQHLAHLREVLSVLRREKLYAALKKCVFMRSEVLFLGYIVAAEDFQQPFELHSDALKVGIGAVLSQNNIPIAFFSEKLTGAKVRYNTYDVEFYAVVQAIKHWRHYLFHKEFILYTDHEALKHLHSQDKVSARHASWVAYLERFTLVTRVHGKAADFVHGLQEIHEAVQNNLKNAAMKYKAVAGRRRRHVEFEVGDFVWAVLTKDRFSAGNYHKLAARKIGPVEIVEKINSNAYRLKLPSHIRTADVFNVKHLIPYTGDSSDEFSPPRGE
ncbi:hypothetical protein CRG98_023868 [Punica granatum]|uniref:Reverse transcriptase domain-containing protein n=1 Tax=Punica granatum TaxID=22663 RepID=A0A2I0JJI2_PUNGR|nr:hypothetical protein CRG98_023868 [Punica granatum]